MELKPFLSFDEQINLLRNRGLVIPNVAEFSKFLSENNYYRVNPYFKKHSTETNVFYEGTTSTKIVQAYKIDVIFRNILLTALQTIEVNFRTRLAYSLAEQLGPDCIYQENSFCSPTVFADYHSHFSEYISIKRNDPIILHHVNNYDRKFPIWVIVEIQTFGENSKLFSNLNREQRQNISTYFRGLKSNTLQDWIYCLVDLRNTCAHYQYLYKLNLKRHPGKTIFFKKNKINTSSIFCAILLIARLLEVKDFFKFMLTISRFEKRFPDGYLSNYGFPINWQELLSTFAISDTFLNEDLTNH